MSVEDRLRSGLSANAAALPVEPDDALARVRERSRRATAALSLAMAAAVVTALVLVGSVLAGHGDTSRPGPAPAPSSPGRATASTTVWTGAVIPDSVWTRILTPRHARKAGLSPRQIRESLGPDRRMPETLQFYGNTWTQLANYKPDVPEVGDRGTFSYDGQGRLVIVSDSPGCPGCAATLRWRIVGERLVLRFVSNSAGRPFDPVERLMTEGVWRRSHD